MILRAFFSGYPPNYTGFYVDVGAHHPVRFSNSLYFYEQGWVGICVDPLPGAALLFAKRRPRDIFLKVGVSANEGVMSYFMFEEPASNTFSEKIADKYADRLLTKQDVNMLPLRQILADNLPAGQAIDFLSVDVEGLDSEVLHSNDWELYRPSVVLIEETEASTLEDVENLEVTIFMKQHGYRAFAHSPNCLFFVDTRSTITRSEACKALFRNLHP